MSRNGPVRSALARIATGLLVLFVLTGCIDEISAIFEIILFEESPDEEVRQTGKVLKELHDEREAQAALDKFLETGDRRHLDAARSLRPDDTEIRGYDVVVATADGDPAAIEAAQEALALAEARRLESFKVPGDPPTTAWQIRRNVLGEILVAQTHMLGGSLNSDWDPPPDNAPSETKALFEDYCATRLRIQTEFDDSLSYIPLPPCPSAS